MVSLHKKNKTRTPQISKEACFYNTKYFKEFFNNNHLFCNTLLADQQKNDYNHECSKKGKTLKYQSQDAPADKHNQKP